MPTQSQLKSVMREAAEAARQILLSHFGKIDTVEKKGVADIVTIADKKSEEAVIRTIRRAFPDHGILAEESGRSESLGAEFLWVIDPLDGTTNYAHGVPIFAVSIGLVREGEPYMGLVVDPIRDEWFHARRGGGAFLNRRRIRVSSTHALGDALLITGFPHGCRRNLRHFSEIIERLLMRSRGVLRLGSAATDLCWVASGRADAFWEETLSPWDVAAGVLIVEEAGGRCSRFDRRRFDIFSDQLLASNGCLHAQLHREIRAAWKEWK